MMASSNIPGLQGIPQPSKARTWAETYLANYNAISAFFWFNVPLRLVQIYNHVGHEYVSGISDYVKYVQMLAILEVVHSATGLVRAPFLTTFVQVFSRIFLTWGIVDLFPDSIKSSFAYPIMLFAWSITEVIRYSYYAWNLVDDVPYPLLWLRYSTFWVLYPLGVGAEIWSTTCALKEAYAWSPLYAAFIVGVILGYIPGFYILYTHMIRQRRKVLGKGDQKEEPSKALGKKKET